MSVPSLSIIITKKADADETAIYNYITETWPKDKCLMQLYLEGIFNTISNQDTFKKLKHLTTEQTSQI
jgi:hypothetical protein